MTPEIPSNVDQLAALQHRIETLEAKLATKPSFFSSRRRRAMAGVVAAVAALGVAGTALASTITDGLYVFVADNPALASEVNYNFNTLRTYLRNKVGTDLTNGNVAVPGTLSAAGATTLSTLRATGGIRAEALNNRRGLEIDWNRSLGIGETDFTNFRENGSGGGFAFYNADDESSARTTLMSIGSTGNVTATGTVTDNSGATTRKFMLADTCGDVNQFSMCPPNMYVCGFGLWNSSSCKRVVCCRLGHDGVSL